MCTIEAPRRVLVTGLAGFTGAYLAAALTAANATAVATPAGFDLREPALLHEMLAGVEFDDVIHLAGLSFVPHERPDELYRVNTVGTVALLEALYRLDRPLGRIILASSANVYSSAGDAPLTEEQPLHPANHYGASKLAMESLARGWFARLPIVITRPFNYTGVGQDPRFLIPKIVDAFRRRAPVIELGNTDVVRDFSDVRTVGAVYADLLDAPPSTVVNICSGTGHSLQWVIDECVAATGHQIEIRVNPAFVRKDEVRRLVGSPKRLVGLTDRLGRPAFRETLRWMLDSPA